MKEPKKTCDPRPRILRIGPRGIQGVFGWTFFDPANLVSLTMLAVSSLMVVTAMQDRGAPDWFMPIGLYLCLALFLRGYFFNYYHGGPLGRSLVMAILVTALLASGLFWEDRAPAHTALRALGTVEVVASGRFHVAALLHLISAITIFVHFCLPRRWIVSATDELADRSGRDTATDAPLSTISDPEERTRREAEQKKG